MRKGERNKPALNGDGAERDVAPGAEPAGGAHGDAAGSLLGGDSGDVSLVFACTVHKAQGGEFPHVVFAVGWDSFKLLSRCLVYTAVSRAQKTH